MPKANYHKNHVNHNISFLNSFIKTYQYNDWAITVAFYALVQIIEYLIAKLGKLNFNGVDISIEHSDQLPSIATKMKIPCPIGFNPTIKNGHKIRSILLKNTKELSPISSDYEIFYKKAELHDI